MAEKMLDLTPPGFFFDGSPVTTIEASRPTAISPGVANENFSKH